MESPSTGKEMIRSLYDLYSNDVYRYAWATLRDSSDAYDVVQEVFLRAYRSLNNYRQEANSKTWLMTIARNYIYDLLRKKRTERKYMSEREIPEIADPATPVDLIMEIDEALSQLKDEYRHVLVLRHIDNLSIHDTASILGWSEKKVRNTTHRAILKLREVFGENSEGVNVSHEIRTR